MNRVIAYRVPLALAAFLFAAPPAMGTGINLRWDDCVNSGVSNGDKVSTCTSDFGAPFELIASVNDPPLMTDLLGIEAVIDIEIAGGQVTDWWRAEAGGCRAGAITLDLGAGHSSPPYSCPQPWNGMAVGGMQYTAHYGGAPNRSRIKVVAAVAEVVTIDPNVAPEWTMFKINILRNGTTSCDGCAQGGCILLNSVKLTRPGGSPGGDRTIVNPGTAQHASWQGSLGVGCPTCFIWCPVVPVSWGQVKGMYR